MSDLLHELENNEAILLMYVAGELPEEERREVEQMLQTDARLRSMYEELRVAWDGTMASLERLDRTEPLLTSREAAARAVGRMVRQRHARRLAERPVAEAALKREFSWPLMLASAAATVAVAVVGYLAWWGMFGEPLGGDGLTGRLMLERAPRTPVLADNGTGSGEEWPGVRPHDPLGLWDDSIYLAETELEHLSRLGTWRPWPDDN
ncbi:MAG: hypothetical protein ACK4PI_13325 [Tepidisphaerales bacterium]